MDTGLSLISSEYFDDGTEKKYKEQLMKYLDYNQSKVTQAADKIALDYFTGILTPIDPMKLYDYKKKAGIPEGLGISTVRQLLQTYLVYKYESSPSKYSNPYTERNPNTVTMDEVYYKTYITNNASIPTSGVSIGNPDLLVAINWYKERINKFTQQEQYLASEMAGCKGGAKVLGDYIKIYEELKLMKAPLESTDADADKRAAAGSTATTDKKGLSTGAWIGIIGGGVVVLTVVAILIFSKNK